jgi:IS605 OrfB family transposase
MKLVAQIQLTPDADSGRKLRATVERFNAACDWIAGECFARKEANVYNVRKFAYHEVRERFGLSSQMAQLAIKAVCDSYKRDKSIKPRFRKHAAMPFDQRTMSFKGIARVSLLTLEGRALIPFIVGRYNEGRLTLPKGQCDLVLRKDGKWFLLVTVSVPDGTEIPATDFIGVDMGIVNIAADSDPDTEPYSGKDIEDVRRKHNLQRKRLQKKGTKGAKKKLKRVARKEARFRRHENHCISKTIVARAKGTGRGIAVEDLGGIREPITARGTDARNRLSGWSFGQLYAFLTYKAQLAGVPIEVVDPAYTSQTCAKCGHCRSSNRKNQSEFVCKACGHRAHADKNAARNIRARALAKRALELDPGTPGSRKSHTL